MDWENVKNLLLQSPTYLDLAPELRQQIEGNLPQCSPEQLQDVLGIIEEDRQNIADFMEASKKFQKDIQRKTMGLEEVLEHQDDMENIEASMANL